MSVAIEVLSAPQIENLPDRLVIEPGSKAIIGRNADCDLCLPCPDKTVSRKHAEIVSRDSHFLLIDHSANGVFVKESGTAIGATEPYCIKGGEVLEIGPFTVSIIRLDQGRSDKTIDPSRTQGVSSSGNLDTQSSDATHQEPVVLHDVIPFSRPLLPEVEEISLEQPQSDLSGDVRKVKNDFGDIDDQFTPPSLTIPVDWDLDPEPVTDRDESQPPKASVVKFASRNTKLVESLIEGLGLEPDSSDQITAEVMKKLGEVLKVTVDGYLQARDQVRVTKSKLSLDKISIDRQKESDPTGKIVDANDFFQRLIDHHNPEHAELSAKLQQSIKYHLEDMEDVLSGQQDVFDRFYKALSPEAITGALSGAERSEDKRSLGLSKLNDGFSTSARKWVFFQRNWKKIFAQVNVSIRKDFEAKFLLAHARRMGSKNEAK